MAFTRAVRAGAPVVIGLVGPSGQGKTLSGLLVARGLIGPKGKLAVLDTESGRARLYSDVTPFDHQELAAPFSPQRYREMIREAVKDGYDALLIDQATFEWAGTGGVLELAEAGGGKGLQRWLGPKTAHRKFMNEIAECPIHLVLCLRAKHQFISEPDPDKPGKDRIVKGGYVAVQHEDFMYEMTVSMVLDHEGRPGVPRLVKCPAALLPAFPEGAQLSERTGEMIAEWVKGGAPVDHAFETLKGEARSMALEGTVKLKAWLVERLAMVKAGALPKAQWDKLKPLMGTELESAARAADAMEAMKTPDETVQDSSFLGDGKKDS